MGPTQKWEFFKFKVREVAIKRSKEIKILNSRKEELLMTQLNNLISRDKLCEDDLKTFKILSEELDKLYINLAKGAFIRSRAKWLEEGEKNCSYFFGLENRKRNNISSLSVNGSITSDPIVIANSISSFYSELYTSEFSQLSCDNFMTEIKNLTPVISENVKQFCQSDLSGLEIEEAVRSMKLKKVSWK